MPPKTDDGACRRCGSTPTTIVVRNEPLCSECFMAYVRTKIIKRLEAFRVRHSTPGSERRLLLALSLGACSLAALHTVNEMLQRQVARTGRGGFNLVVAHITDDQSRSRAAALFEQVRGRYEQHEYILEDLKGDELVPASNGLALLTNPLDNSPSSHADLLSIRRMRQLVEIAKQARCEGVLWGDSTTRLAEKVLAETAKGRGASLPWLVSDGLSPLGVSFYFPLRDLMRKEVDAYAQTVSPPLTEIQLVSTPPARVTSTKNSTIDGLMTDYFASVEQAFPSIVANVVRTTSRLQPNENADRICNLCCAPLMPAAGQDTAASSPNGNFHGNSLCYGCSRSALGRV